MAELFKPDDKYYREIEHGQHFLGTAHTLSNYTTAFYESNIAHNHSYEQWLEEGGLNDEQRACEVWKRQLEEYEAPAIDAGADEALREYIERVKGGRDDRWY